MILFVWPYFNYICCSCYQKIRNKKLCLVFIDFANFSLKVFEKFRLSGNLNLQLNLFCGWVKMLRIVPFFISNERYRNHVIEGHKFIKEKSKYQYRCQGFLKRICCEIQAVPTGNELMTVTGHHSTLCNSRIQNYDIIWLQNLMQRQHPMDFQMRTISQDAHRKFGRRRRRVPKSLKKKKKDEEKLQQKILSINRDRRS